MSPYLSVLLGSYPTSQDLWLVFGSAHAPLNNVAGAPVAPVSPSEFVPV